MQVRKDWMKKKERGRNEGFGIGKERKESSKKVLMTEKRKDGFVIVFYMLSAIISKWEIKKITKEWKIKYRKTKTWKKKKENKKKMNKEKQVVIVIYIFIYHHLARRKENKGREKEGRNIRKQRQMERKEANKKWLNKEKIGSWFYFIWKGNENEKEKRRKDWI